MSYGTNGTFTVNNLVGGTTKAITPRTVNNTPAPKPIAANSPYANLIALGQANAYAANNITNNPAYAAAASQTPDLGAISAANRAAPTLADTGAAGAGGAAAKSTVDPELAAMYGDQAGQAQAQIDSLGGTQDTLLGNINNGYQNSLKDNNDQFALAQRDYNTSRDDTIVANDTAKTNIDGSVARNTNSVQRLLGLAGSGNSSAARYAAFLAAKQGTEQRTAVNDSYNKNLRQLDTSFGDTTVTRDKNLKRLEADRFAKEQDVKNSINSNKSSLLQTLANLRIQQGQAMGKTYSEGRAAADPYFNQIASLRGESAGLLKNYASPTFTTDGVAFKPAPLASYATKDAGVKFDGQTAATEQAGPAYLPGLKRDEKGNVIV